MTDRKHPRAISLEVHQPFRWTFANTAARTALNVGAFFADDVGCLAWQTDDNTVWLAKATGIGAGKWQRVDAGAAGTLIGPGSSTDFALALWNGTAGTTLRNGVLLHPSTGSDPTADLHVTKKGYVDKTVREVRNVKKTAAGGGTTYTISATDETIEGDTNAGILTLNLQAYANSNKNILTVYDQGKHSSTNPIILHPESGKSINGGTAGANLSLALSGSTWTIWPLADASGYGVSGPV